MAWIIEKVGRPALVIAHNKTLAAQLCNEFREFFPEQRGRVLRLVLRLLPARGVRPAGRPLHREGLVAERRHRRVCASRRPPRSSRAATSSSSPRSRASTASARPRSARERVLVLDVGEEHDRDEAAAQADRQPVRAQRHACSAAAASASRATWSRCSRPTPRPPTASRSSATRSSRSRTSTRSPGEVYAPARQPRDLPGHASTSPRSRRSSAPSRRSAHELEEQVREVRVARAACSRRTGSGSAPSTTSR